MERQKEKQKRSEKRSEKRSQGEVRSPQESSKDPRTLSEDPPEILSRSSQALLVVHSHFFIKR